VDLPRYLRVRAEGLPLRKAIWSGLSYVRKNLQPKRSAPLEEVRYFNAQRQLLRWLARLGASCSPQPEPRLAMVGDLMWLRDGWNTFLSPEVLAYLNGHAVVLGNLESPISRRFKVPSLLPDYFTYNADPGLLTSFRRPDGRNTWRRATTTASIAATPAWPTRSTSSTNWTLPTRECAGKKRIARMRCWTRTALASAFTPLAGG
jgi:hypothetical protein